MSLPSTPPGASKAASDGAGVGRLSATPKGKQAGKSGKGLPLPPVIEENDPPHDVNDVMTQRLKALSFFSEEFAADPKVDRVLLWQEVSTLELIPKEGFQWTDEFEALRKAFRAEQPLEML